MTKEIILSEINDCIQNKDLQGLDVNLDLLLKVTDNDFASVQLSAILGKNYTQFKSDYLAKVLEIIIRKRPMLALVNHPFNFLFQTTVSTGSFEMYECYIEEAVIPFLSNVISDEHEIHWMELLNTAQELSDKLFLKHKKCLKGTHYNGAFSKLESDEHIDLIHHQDYQIMADVIERYNSIVGRGEIIRDLNVRSGLE